MEKKGRAKAERARKVQYGVSDLPIQPRGDMAIESLDKLELTNYYKGLSEFIRGCVTPMTLAVQGAWGSGKTSALNSIMDSLKSDYREKIDVVYINTWQYSLFNADETLVFSVLQRIVDTFQSEVRESSKPWENPLSDYDQLVEGIKQTVTKLARFSFITLGATQGVDLTNYVQSGEVRANSDELLDLKQRFSTLVEKYCEKQGKEKIVFFVDDLDRLKPELAVELLEVFKVLLDVSNTVFVLAIDFDIVKLGISQRYFHEAGEDVSSEWKARSFFDKIVQVPFNMPTAAYNPAELIREQLDTEVSQDSALLNRYTKAVHLSVGVNPRAIKRLFNAYALTRIITSSHRRVSEDSDHLYRIFLLIAMEIAYPKAYQELTLAATTFSRFKEEATENIAAKDAQASVERILLINEENVLSDSDYLRWDIRPDDLSKFTNFLYLLKREFEDDDEVSVQWDLLKDTLEYTVVTSVNVDQASTGESNVDEGSTTGKLIYQGLYKGLGHPKPPILLFQDSLNSLIQERRNEDANAFRRGAIIAPIGYLEQPDYSAYMANSVEELEGLKTRSRPKFLSLRQNKTSLQIGFGSRKNIDLDEESEDKTAHGPVPVEELLQFFGSEWWDIIRKLEADENIPRLTDASSRKVEFGFTLESAVNPILIKGISSQEHVNWVIPYIESIYDSVLDNSPF